jgi:branched-chain amino acid transport system substrate-binding protein
MRSFRVLGAGGAALLAALSAAAGPAAAQVSDDVVKIGVLTDMSSVYSDLTGRGSVIAAEMAVEDFGGTVLGKKIEIVSADHQNKPDVGAAIAREWLDTGKVDMISDLPTSSVALAVQRIVDEKNRVLMISGGGSSDLTGPACTATTVQWTYDTYELAKVVSAEVVKRGGDTWFFLTADYAFGHALERDAKAEVEKAGGKVIGAVRHPLHSSDFSSFLLQAQASKAKVVAFANAGQDFTTVTKQSSEFGLRQGGQQIVGLLVEIPDIRGLGLETTQGMLLTQNFYWDLNDETRAWTKRFAERKKSYPSSSQAGMYSLVLHYLKAIQAAGTDEAKAVMAKMKATRINDMFAKDAYIREDGRMVHEAYLMQVKKPSESKGEWDLYNVVATVPGDQAFRPIDEGGCPLVKKKS